MDALLLVKATLLLSAALLGARMMRGRAAVIRHQLWSAAFAALLALPLLTLILPAIRVPLPQGWAGAPPVTSTAMRPGEPATAREPVAAPKANHGRPLDDASAEQGAQATGVAAQTQDRRSERGAQTTRTAISLRVLPPVLWLAGALASAAALLLSLIRLRSLERTAEDVEDPAWRRAADALGARLRLRRAPRLLVSPAVSTPMAGGVLRPVVFLPAAARAWSAERRDLVLAHEIAHLAACDPLRVLAVRVAVALYWFHPLAWMAARQSAVAREEACDEVVLALGTRPSVYARVLLDLAESMQTPVPVLGALPMVHPSLLEKRLMAILTNTVRPATKQSPLIAALGIALLALPVAAARPADHAAVPQTAPAPEIALGPANVPPPATVPSTPPAASAPPRPIDVAEVPAVLAIQAEPGRDSACWWDFGGGSFSGSMSTSNVGGRTVIHEQVGSRGADRVIQQRFGDLRLCMIAEDVGPDSRSDHPSDWIGRASRVVLEARRGERVQRLEISRQAGGSQSTSWQVGSVQRSFDASAEQWRERMLAVLDTTWELSTLRGSVSSLRGQISSIRGQESSLRGEISSLRGEVSSMRGRASSIQGEESSLRGRISAIQGHVSSLRGAISSERGAISSLRARDYRADAAERARIDASVKEHDAEIARIEKAIRDYDAEAKIAAVEREIAALDAPGKIAAIEAEIRAFDLEGKVAAVERRIAELDVEGKVAAIEREIEALDADRRGRQLEERRRIELKQLEAAIAAIG